MNHAPPRTLGRGIGTNDGRRLEGKKKKKNRVEFGL